MMQLPERFRTPGLLLTRIGMDDLQDMAHLYREANVAAGLGPARPDAEIGAHLERLAADWERHGFGWWAVRDPASGRFIGRGGLRPTTLEGIAVVGLDCALLPQYWNRGFATELARVSVAQGFVRLHLGEVMGLTLPSNQGARRVMEKTGLSFERGIAHAGAQQLLYRLTAASWRTGTSRVHGRRPEELVAG